jgi:hypothetical protein
VSHTSECVIPYPNLHAFFSPLDGANFFPQTITVLQNITRSVNICLLADEESSANFGKLLLLTGMYINGKNKMYVLSRPQVNSSRIVGNSELRVRPVPVPVKVQNCI